MDEGWFLEGVAADGSHVAHAIHVLPFVVGREAGNQLVVAAAGLSRRHAELRDEGGRIVIADLGSTNGTFVNRERLQGPRALAENDVIHFGNAEFRLGRAGAARDAGPATAPLGDHTVIAPPGQTLSGHFVPHERQFHELLSGHGLSGAVQRIVGAVDGRPFAYELLARGAHAALPGSPVHLFRLAAQLDREAELSRAFREHGLRTLAERLAGQTVFVNAHPKETFEDAFLAGLVALRRDGVRIDLVVEVHETAVMEIVRMRELAARLAEIGVRFAYDDFGAGQARLNELGEVPAHFVKFDMALVQGIDRAPPSKRKVVADLVRLVHELGSVALAEGVETEAEARVCRELGFELLQGYLTGRPVPIEQF
jgi:EAL domain-containing protein (putative c-di-GMP-specific phosphodiesterase class I)